MTTAAWWMMGVTWVVIAFFTFRFFVRVARAPGEPPPAEGGSEEVD